MLGKKILAQNFGKKLNFFKTEANVPVGTGTLQEKKCEVTEERSRIRIC